MVAIGLDLCVIYGLIADTLALLLAVALVSECLSAGLHVLYWLTQPPSAVRYEFAVC